MQVVDLKNPRAKFLFLQNSHSVFPPFFKYHVVFHNQSEDYIVEDGIINTTSGTV